MSFSRQSFTSILIASAVVLAPIITTTAVQQAGGGPQCPVVPTSDERNGPH